MAEKQERIDLRQTGERLIEHLEEAEPSTPWRTMIESTIRAGSPEDPTARDAAIQYIKRKCKEYGVEPVLYSRER